ncbi:MAG TPA: A/G-specific adenine glycosylase [Acidimicrobiia bacterium]|nr:A/G-specific adenine glycosylase [Acidimicrobiia bacterium]
MLHQTQVARVAGVYDGFLAQFPTPSAMAAAGPGAVIVAWGRLGYPRRARRLWEAAVVIDARGWPADLTDLPGVGRYTAAAVRAQSDGVDAPALDVNVRRVVERVRGERLTDAQGERAMVVIGKPLRGRDRLLALMDVGALLCRPREPRCGECPLRRRCAARAPLPHERRARQAPFAGSFRERRGRVMARVREGAVPVEHLDADALASLVADGLAVLEHGSARLPDL